MRAAAAEAIALQGCVLTPTGPVEDGYVVVGAGRQIQAVQARRHQHAGDGVRSRLGPEPDHHGAEGLEVGQ